MLFPKLYPVTECMLRNFFPQDIEIQGWCQVGSVLSHGKKMPLLVLVGHPFSVGVTIKIPYVVDALLH